MEREVRIKKKLSFGSMNMIPELIGYILVPIQK